MAKINVNIYIKRDYEESSVLEATKNKANLFRIEYCVMRIAKRNLKKQSQFSAGKIDIKRFHSKELRRYLLYWRIPKTKPIQSQTKPNLILRYEILRNWRGVE